MDKRIREILEAAIASNVSDLLHELKGALSVNDANNVGEIEDDEGKIIPVGFNEGKFLSHPGFWSEYDDVGPRSILELNPDSVTKIVTESIINHIEHWERTKQIERIEGLGSDE